MSDSLNATVMVMVLVLTISAKPELLEDDELLELPRLPELPVLPVLPVLLAFVPVPAEALPDPLEPELPVLEKLEALPPEISSPGLVDSSETIVPLAGAYRRVSSSAVCALRRLSRALSTDAWAEAMVAGDGVVVVAAPDREPLPLLPEPEPEPEPELCDPVCEPVPPVLVVLVRPRPGVVVLGAVTVVVVVVVVVVGAVVVVGVEVVVGAVLVSDTNWVGAASTPVLALLAPDDDVEVPSSAEVS